MNWKKYPQLFANGKFEATSGGVTFKIIGVQDCGFWLISKHCGVFLMERCGLIARPISDMSDEEKEKREDMMYFDYDTGKCIEVPKSFLYLLSIGVYPFEDDVDVIWRYENE